MGAWIFIVGVIGFFLWLAYVETVADHAISKEKERERERTLKNLPEPTQIEREKQGRRDLREGRRWGVLVAALVLVVNVVGGFILLPFAVAYYVALGAILLLALILIWPLIGWG